jgi:Protein of unknown function (DUF1496)
MMKLSAMHLSQRLALLFSWTTALCIVSPLHAADAVCLYQSRSYSEGAFICVQKSLMQTCTSDGTRMVWRIVTDSELGNRCVAALTYAEPRRRWVRRAHMVRQPVAAEPASAKCFVFNGKRYCE